MQNDVQIGIPGFLGGDDVDLGGSAQAVQILDRLVDIVDVQNGTFYARHRAAQHQPLAHALRRLAVHAPSLHVAPMDHHDQLPARQVLLGERHAGRDITAAIVEIHQITQQRENLRLPHGRAPVALDNPVDLPAMARPAPHFDLRDRETRTAQLGCLHWRRQPGRRLGRMPPPMLFDHLLPSRLLPQIPLPVLHRRPERACRRRAARQQHRHGKRQNDMRQHAPVRPVRPLFPTDRSRRSNALANAGIRLAGRRCAVERSADASRSAVISSL
ncbi:hypothetical protein DM47_3680 [Burkholderia mallei]|nr:hypothetical protein DM75_4255 [Burkholderia mallei]KOT16264.1 hypothetical protein DM47_3680 [Burkholderia mallei]